MGPSPGSVGRPFPWALHEGQPLYIIGTDTTSVRDLEYPIKVPTEGAVLLTVYSRLTDIPQPVGFSI